MRSQLQRSDEPVFASFGQCSQVLGQFKPSCPKQVLGTYLPQTAPNCPKPIFVHHFVKKPAPNLFLDTYLSKTYLEAPICPKIVLHLIVQNLFLATYLSKTAQNLFKDFDGYVEMASDLVFCYRMLHGSNELDY